MSEFKKNPMKIVCKNDPERTIRTLTQEEQTAIYYAFGKGEARENQKYLAKTIAETVKDSNGWLQCYCQSFSPPLMTVVQNEQGFFHLRRLTARAEHDRRCVFYSLESESTNLNKSKVTSRPWSADKPLNLHRHGQIHDNNSPTTTSSRNQSIQNRGASLAALLYTLIGEAKLNTVDVANPPTIQESYARLKEVTKKYQLVTGVSVEKYFWTYPNVGVMQRQLESQQSRWPKDERPYCLCVNVADKVSESTLYFLFKDKPPIEIKAHPGKIYPSSGRLSEKSAPYLALFTFTNIPERPDQFAAMKAFYVPVYSKSQLIPVDSHYERRVLQALIKAAKIWYEQNLKFTITKPLFDAFVKIEDEKQAFRPDFLIETPKRKIFFEVMGSIEPEYKETKQRTVKAMQQLGEVLEFEAIRLHTIDQWNTELENKLNKILQFIVHDNSS